MKTTPSKNTSLRPRRTSTDFVLQKMSDIYSDANGITDIAHRHEYYTVLLVGAIRGDHIIDYQSYPFGNHQVHFINPGQIHQVIAQAKPEGWVITFSRDFLVENNIPETFISNINLFYHFSVNPPLQLEKEVYDKLEKIIFEMRACMELGIRYRDRAVGALLQLFLIHCINSCTADTAQFSEEDASICLFRDFKKLVEEKYKKWHQVTQYARHIHISPKHLSQTIKDLTGKGAKEFIQDRINLESKRLLLHTSLSIKEIGFQLGFSDPLHFSSYFRKQTGSSPTQFRSAS